MQGESMASIIVDAMHQHRASNEQPGVKALYPSTLFKLLTAVRVTLGWPETQHLLDIGVLNLCAGLDVLRSLLPNLLLPPSQGLELSLQLPQGIVALGS
jgi:hypothetical protein